MSVNRYKLRNFDNHHKDGFHSLYSQSCDRTPDIAVSNAIYDRNRMITHGFIKTGISTRLVCDVELAMSSDPSVRSVISPDAQRNLRMAISHAPSPSASVPDSELIESVVPVYGVERSDAIAMAESFDFSYPSPGASSPDDSSPDDSAPTD